MDYPIKQEYHLQMTDREAITKHNQENSPLLRLPPELRNCIYAYAFDSATFTCNTPRTGVSPYQCRINCDSSHLHEVCRQVRSEVALYCKKWSWGKNIVTLHGVIVFYLIEWVADAQRAGILEIHMSSPVAEAFHRRVKRALCLAKWKLRRFQTIDERYPSVQRIVVTCTEWPANYEIDIRSSLQSLFANPDLEVQYKLAKSSV